MKFSKVGERMSKASMGRGQGKRELRECKWKGSVSSVVLVCSRPGKEPRVAGEEIREGTRTRLHRIWWATARL